MRNSSDKHSKDALEQLTGYRLGQGESETFEPLNPEPYEADFI